MNAAQKRVLAIERQMVDGDESGLKSQTKLANTTGTLSKVILGVVGAAVLYAAGTVWHAYQVFNTPEMGHMISTIDSAQKAPGDHGGLAYALSYDSGLWREVFFYGQTQLPLAVVTAFASPQFRTRFVQDLSGNISKLKGMLEQQPKTGVDVLLCSLFPDLSSCHELLCPHPNSRQAKITGSAIRGASMGVGVGMMASEMNPAVGLALGLVGGVGYGFMAYKDTPKCQ